MDAAYLSALAALAGSTIGGVTSLTASWLTQHVQYRAEQQAQDLSRREDLYKHFIEEASRLFADAYAHSEAEISSLVGIYALVSRMRVLSAPKIVESADQVVRVIIATYRGPNKTFGDVIEILDDQSLDPLRQFSNACREELRRYAG
jgi:hypothetical protein